MNNQVNILVVEDDPEQRQLIVDILTSASYHVSAADSVEQAILALKSTTFDVIFSDWKLGELSGIELLSYVRLNLPEIGFVIATAYGTINHAVEAMQKGADDYIPKPFNRQELLLTIDKARKAQQLRLENKQLSSQLGQQSQLMQLVGNAPAM